MRAGQKPTLLGTVHFTTVKGNIETTARPTPHTWPTAGMEFGIWQSVC